MFNFSSYTNHIACICSTGRQVTYGELDEMVCRIGQHVQPHQLVFCLCSNTIDSIAGYVAFLKNNNASLLLDSNITQDAFRDLIRVYHPQYIWAPTKQHPNLPIYTEANPVLEEQEYTLWKTNSNGTPVAENLALLLATSGSTGSPKLVRLTQDNLRSNAMAIIRYLNITDKERPILGLPMNYAYGLSIVNSHLMKGATLLLTDIPFVDRTFLQFANENHFTSYSGVPYAFDTIRKLGILHQAMPSLRTITIAGGNPNWDTLRCFHDTFSPQGVNIYVMYGQAEATARMAYLDPHFLTTKKGSIGKAIPGGQLSLVDENGEIITSSYVIGELVYQGNNVCLGYAEQAEDLLRGDDNQGRIHTGDLAYRDKDGFYYMAGRKGRFVKLFGHRISLDHIETLLLPVLFDCACIGDDAHLTVFTSEPYVNENNIIDMLSARTKIPRKAFSVCRIDKLPRSKSGKVLYKELVNQWNTL